MKTLEFTAAPRVNPIAQSLTPIAAATIVLCCLIVIGPADAAPARNPRKVVGGKPLGYWLSMAATDIAATSSPFPAVNAVELEKIVQTQIEVGDHAGATKTVESMEKSAAGAGPNDFYPAATLASAEVSTGRNAQARALIDKETKQGPRGGGLPIGMTTVAARLGDVDQSAAKINSATMGKPALLVQFSWVMFQAKRDPDGDKLLSAAIAEAAKSTGQIGEAATATPLSQMLAYRGRGDEAVEMIASHRRGLPWVTDIDALLDMAHRSSNLKTAANVASSIVGRIKKDKKQWEGFAGPAAVALARNGHVDAARDLLKDFNPSGKADPAFDSSSALVEIYAKAPEAPAKFDTTAKHLDRMESASIYAEAAEAFAQTDDDAPAIAALEKAGPNAGPATGAVLECLARIGKADDAVARLKSVPADFRPPVIRKLARGWGESADSKGFAAWVATLKDSSEKSQAELGAVEGALGHAIVDQFEIPSSAVTPF